jgi:multiple sugar transport system permease protein
MQRRKFWTRILMHVLLLPFLVFALFPFYHMTLTSLKQDRELYDRHAMPLIIKQGPTLDHYVKLIRETEFLTWTKNSLLVTALATSASVVIGTIAAYALSRLKFFGVNTFGTGIFVTYLVPTSLLFLPLAQVINWLGLADSKWALIVTYPTFLVPFCTWLLMGYFRTVPKEVEECAMVDGATRMQALWRIVLPIAVPGLVCAVLFAFTLSWNEFIYALTFTSSSEQVTASVGVTSELIRGDIYFWGELMAGAILGSVPIVILYVFFIDYYVSGLTAGACRYFFSASIPACATCASCAEVTPETPMPPMTLPSARIGMPPSSMLAPVRPRSRTFSPPLAIRSWKTLVGRRKATAEYAFSRATSTLPNCVLSRRLIATS